MVYIIVYSSLSYPYRSLLYYLTNRAETTTETPPSETPAETPKKEESKKEEETKEATEPAEKKSIFAALCGCFGGSASPADTDTKEAHKRQ